MRPVCAVWPSITAADSGRCRMVEGGGGGDLTMPRRWSRASLRTIKDNREAEAPACDLLA